MPDVREFQQVVESAEKAAAAGDFAAAEQLLREAADLQEASLGALHPDLASTFNNLAVACEMTGKPADAEQFYRRAYGIAAASLGPEHPLVATSRDNLRDFCKARGLPLEEWPDAAPAAPPAPVAAVSAARVPAVSPAPVPAVSPTPVPAVSPTPAAAVPGPLAAAPPPASPAPAGRSAALSRAAPPPPGAAAARRFAAAVAIVGLLAILAVARLWLTADRGTSGPPAGASTADAGPEAGRAAPGAPAAADPPPAAREPATATSAPVRPTPSPAAPILATPPSSASTPADVRVVTASVCRTLDTGQGPWRCDAVTATNAPGRFSYFTRIAAPRSVRVRHRWYQGDRLRQDVVLTVGANARDGYRTFSRQTVSPGEWRVELQAANGAVLGETRFVVR